MFTMRYGCLRWVQLLGAGLAAVAVNAVALIWELAQMGFLTIRYPVTFSQSTLRPQANAC